MPASTFRDCLRFTYILRHLLFEKYVESKSLRLPVLLALISTQPVKLYFQSTIDVQLASAKSHKTKQEPQSL